MPLDINKLAERVRERVGGSGSRFDNMFVDAVNRVSSDLAASTTLEPAMITNPSGTLAVDSWLAGLYSDGCVFYLCLSGEWGKKPDENQRADYRRTFAVAQSRIIADAAPEVGYPTGESE